MIVFAGNKSFENTNIKFPNNIGIKYVRNINSNPKAKDLHDSFIGCRVDCMLAIGGGSVIDFAKAYIWMYYRPKHFIVVTTTAGSGSEATNFAAVYDGMEKISLTGKDIMPDLVISDPEIINTMPDKIKYASYIDALVHSIESQWSKQATKKSLRYSNKAYDLLMRHDYIDGSYYAGKAINISKTNIIHALSYYLMLKYKILHGFSVGIVYIKIVKPCTTRFIITNILHLCKIHIPDIPDITIEELKKYANKERFDNFDREKAVHLLGDCRI